MSFDGSFSDDHIVTDEELAEVVSSHTDAANADAFVRAYPDVFRYVAAWGSWLAYDGTRWVLPSGKGGAIDSVSQAIIRCMRVREIAAREMLARLNTELEELRAQNRDSADVDARIKFTDASIRFLAQSQNSSRISACERLARGKVGIELDALDSHPWLLNVANGTIDLRTGTLRHHDRLDYLTQYIDVEYDPDALAPTWERFLDRAMAGNIRLVAYLRRLVGYTLTGVTDEQCIAFHYGASGANGKSTFLNALRDLMGDYACSGPRTLLFEPKNGGVPHPTELARLYAKRFVTCPEVPEDVELAEAKIKDLTGSDVVAVRRMNEDFWDLHPTHKLHAAGNHKPIVRGTDGGIWRRLKLVPWMVMIPIEERDAKLPQKLRSERQGILAWAVQGCLEWQENGLQDPTEVVSAGKEYREESDVTADFFAMLKFERNALISSNEVYSKYTRWAEHAGLHPWSATRLARRLTALGASPQRTRINGQLVRAWSGVKIKTAAELSIEFPEGGIAN